MQKKFSFDSETIKKIKRGALIAGAGALLTFLEETVPGIDFGEWSLLATALNSFLINLIKEFIQGK